MLTVRYKCNIFRNENICFPIIDEISQGAVIKVSLQGFKKIVKFMKIWSDWYTIARQDAQKMFDLNVELYIVFKFVCVTK